MKAPYPYFGGKSKVASVVWDRLGDPPNYIEPFFGSGAVLLARPQSHQWADRIETVNDLDGLIVNFWRALQADPASVAHWADWPVSECDLHARHAWLVGQKRSLQGHLEGDPDYYDAKIAGWWVWGISSWIGGGWCSGDGPWEQVEGLLIIKGDTGKIKRELPHLSNAGMGINRKRPHLGDAGMGINLQPHLGDAGAHCEAWSQHLEHVMRQLSDRFRRVRICCGDWSRICGPTPTEKLGITGVFLDPPYSPHLRDDGLYSTESDVTVAVRAWAITHGDNPNYRIALCGYEEEHEMPIGWTEYHWTASAGYGSMGTGRGRDNRAKEMIWFSPFCVPRNQLRLF